MAEYNSGNQYKANVNYENDSLYKPAKTGPVCRRTCVMPPCFKCSCGRN